MYNYPGPFEQPQPQFGLQAGYMSPVAGQAGYISPVGFGTFDTGKAAPVPKTPKSRISIAAVLICFFLPITVFAAVCGAKSFAVRQTSPALVAITMGIVFVATGICIFLAGWTAWKRWYGETSREPFWYIFLATTMVAGLVAGFCLGEANFQTNQQPVIDLQSLTTDYHVDPATMTGQELMDVGRVVFVQGTKLDQTMQQGFKNVDTYCVAPIVKGNQTLPTYDFWAIGLNCCSGIGFYCGEYNNPNARAGLRLMSASQRPFYRLAVEKAEAAFNIHAKYPLFFYWVEDPGMELDSYKAAADQAFYLGILSFAAVQLVLVLAAMVVHAKF